MNDNEIVDTAQLETLWAKLQDAAADADRIVRESFERLEGRRIRFCGDGDLSRGLPDAIVRAKAATAQESAQEYEWLRQLIIRRDSIARAADNVAEIASKAGKPIRLSIGGGQN
ncbi:MAG TPA: hypothetical protein VIF61_09240 [Methylocystis sp.]|jgi:hypothetical protein